ncbi:NeuroparsinReceptor [Frankliniella occidentalis]|uniref:Gamma-aminobutyric acid type B receptor subunit 2 n=1 Tax=Frankliniella occidentalis TaxID=133901 RepID=A0A6J1TRC2_FRAOC|nr:uncharacterized protein LOC113217524 isoform X1 [Frankliniella occidentalis]XP_052126169.1 uncharacterized protein LOC113217524 isoform X1 [Frankliniella occidentalis]KAE8743927.1 NeuroparsinReceptor [Frankliniella occidentalis]
MPYARPPTLVGPVLALASVVLLLVLGPALGPSPVLAERCLTDYPEENPPRFLLVGGEPTDLRLETSRRRLTHRLITHVFRTFLLEVLGYDAVKVVYVEDSGFNTTRVVNRIGGADLGEDARSPRSMVNLEVWTGPDDSLAQWWSEHSMNVLEAGPVTNPGRFAWFVPRDGRGELSDLTWKSFNSPGTAERFSLSSHDFDFFNIDKVLRDDKGFYCTEEFCENGRYTPSRCKLSQNCATLFTSYSDMTGFVKHHIEELQLFVEVIWVGPHLGNLTTEIAKRYKFKGVDKEIVLLGWSPSELTIPGDMLYSIVTFPPCEEMMSSKIVGCKYDLQRLLKLAWNKLKEAAPPAYESIRKVQFDHADYHNLVQRSQEAGSLSDEKVACEWLRENKEKWKDWVWSNDNKDVLYIGGIFPLSGHIYSARGIVIAARMAREAINNNKDILRDYKLRLLVADGQCRADVVMKTFIDYIYLDMYPKLVGVLGPACSDSVEPLAGVSKLYRTVVISYSAEGSSFSDRSKYPYFYRTIGENNQYKNVYLQLFQQIGWTQVASLTEDGQRYTEYLSHLQDLMQTHGIQYIANRKFPRNRDSTAMPKYLKELKSKNARILIGDVNDDAARSLMCAAYHLDMTSKHGYVWFLPLWLSPHWYDISSFNNSSELVNCSTGQMIEAINGHLALTHTYYADDNETMQEKMSVGQWKEKYKEECERNKIETHNYAGFAYDAVWTYAFALDALMKENQSHLVTLHNETTVKRYVEIISATDFNGVSGRINFKSGPSRSSVLQVVQWLNNKTYTVGTYFPNTSVAEGGGRLELNKSAIVWLTPDGSVPLDGKETLPQCVLAGFANALNVNCEVAIAIANVAGFGLLGTLLIVAFIIMKRRYDQKVQITQKYMRSLGIDLLSPSNIACLDKWEIPREFVVVNRKLGEGAFGTVYGGETKIDDKGWIAVAVKTLKIGSTMEEKLDFLSEAEVMKRLDHKNVVKLIGVCTKIEPVYTVMEFMLYGDLKTYLLARRHLVYEKVSEESDEVSNKRLTSMALDVARALSYLAELKYVHRDVASRNCLVNVSRVVKLGDFGMTRPMFENDYYKFNRKGMLPVRWMSPESLALGVFTPASDVWAYGVLLYETITFGSFPFQGLSNIQVLESVKAGNTITIPSGVKPQLESLIKSCWNADYKKRPHASEIVEFLANNPRLLSPCLDVPLSSVQIEDTGELEISLPERRRKCSVSLNFLNRNVGRSQSVNADPVLAQQETTRTTLLDSSVCPTEPLLGTPRSSTAGMGLSKYVTLQHSPSRASPEHHDEYSSHDTEVVSIL